MACSSLTRMINLQGFPTGVITFLFTDWEGKMRSWEDYPYEMKTALARQDSILKSAIENDHGKTIKTTGDDLHAAFPLCQPHHQRSPGSPDGVDEQTLGCNWSTAHAYGASFW